jgi:uncharacterized glyoxalase superfamily protein PhnB
MSQRAVPMLHVPNVDTTADWYASIGFTIRDKGSDGDEIVWASLTFGDSEIMLNTGGQPSDAHRREVDLYLYVDDVEEIFRRIGDRVDVVEAPHDTFYRMREFIIRDVNRFWITFGQVLGAR